MQANLQRCFEVGDGRLHDEEKRRLAVRVGEAWGGEVHPHSLTPAAGGLVFSGLRGGERQVGILSPAARTGPAPPGAAEASAVVEGVALRLAAASASAAGAAWLRELIPAVKPRPLGLRRAIGFGDRLGLATPGHVRAVRKSSMAPVFAQQSVRENERTGRSPQEVLDDALFGAFQEGWREPWGADADHLKTTADIDAFSAAGFSFFTVDPGAHVDNAAAGAAGDALTRKLAAVPWTALETTPEDLVRRLAVKPVDLGVFAAPFDAQEVLRAAAKYGKAVAHTVALYRHLNRAAGGRGFDFEMSVDETDTPTSLCEHVYVAAELRRLGVRWVSLAPRFVGAFEKGVDFIGDAPAFERSFAGHVAVARALGPYKLSIHSGSDKLSIYPAMARLAGELVHLKTAGTSYLEALRVVALFNPGLFAEILGFAVGRYPIDRATYHVSAEVARLPAAAVPSGLLDDFHGRQILHVTYGSVLNEARLRTALFDTLRRHTEDYARLIEAHFDKHLSLFG